MRLATSYAKITWRIVSLLFLCYILVCLDRISIGFVRLQRKPSLGYSDAVYGLGAGIFFLGYFLFEAPSNILLVKIGVHKTITRIIVVCGVISAAMAFIHATWLFYTLRFLLGAFEGGFFPGIILYLMLWYSGSYRGGSSQFYPTRSPLLAWSASPLAGWIIKDLAGIGGLAGWQRLIILEGILTILLGVFVFFYLDDQPDVVGWLTTGEKL